MSELTPIPAEHRHLYHEALRAGLAEAERRELDLDALPFAAFHRALYRPMVELIEAATRRQVAEEIEAELVCCDIHAEVQALPSATAKGKRLRELATHRICYWAACSAAIARGRGETETQP